MAQTAAIDQDSVDRLLDRSFKVREKDPDQALAWADAALRWAEERHDSLRIADAWRKIALAQHQGQATLSTSFASMERALMLSASISDDKGEQSAAKSLGMWYKDRGEYVQALEYADRSLRIAEGVSDVKGICSALVTKGTIEKGGGDMGSAAATFYRGLELARQLEDTAKTLSLLNNIGNCYFELERIGEASTYFHEQYELAKRSGRSLDLADATRNLGMIAAEGRGFQRALELVDSALVIMGRSQVPLEGQFIAMGQKGHYLLELGRLLEARAALDTAVRISKDLNRPTDRSFMLSDLGEVELREGHFARSDSALHEALREAGRHKRARMMALRRLSTLREREGRWQEAKETLSDYVAVRDSFINEKATDQLARAEMRQKYKAHEQELEISDLGDRISQERRLRNLVLGITLLAVVLAAMAWRNWRFQRRLRLQADALHGHEVSRLLKQQEIRTLDAVMRGQELERTRVAKDLHDRVGMLLSAVKMQFGALEGRIEKAQASAGARYQRVTDLLDTAVGEVRRISHDMEHGNLATFGLAAALEDLRDAVHVPGKLDVELNTFGLTDRLDKRLEVAAYRMVQEAVSNALKHAKADHLSIQATRSETLLNLMVEDDGSGFDPGTADGGMGMSNLRSRAAEFNGSVRIDSLPGRGTTVVIDLPIPGKTP